MSERQVDALIVGGGPVGLALALGLRRSGLKVLVLEKCQGTSADWSSAYSYRIDQRGIACFRDLGILAKLEERGVPHSRFGSTHWKPDGSFKEVASKGAAMALGYCIQRPQLLTLLAESLSPEDILIGELKGLRFEEQCIADVSVQGQPSQISSRFIFGCDGGRSIVRSSLQTVLGADFEPCVLDTPSSGLVFRAVLWQPPEDFDPKTMYSCYGKSGRSISMLPFSGRPGEPRPISFARHPSYILHNMKTPEAVYAALNDDFPQLQADQRLSRDAADAWCSSPGSTFPRARWCPRAAHWFPQGIGVALLGDSLHCFPPDLGQGVNAGLTDVAALLALWPKQDSESIAAEKCFTEYDKQQAPEAEAICRLLPVGMPYQYNLPFSFAKCAFLGGLMGRLLANKLCPWIFDAPAIFLVTQAPPLRYTECLERHHRNDRRLALTLLLGLGAPLFLLSWRRVQHR